MKRKNTLRKIIFLTTSYILYILYSINSNDWHLHFFGQSTYSCDGLYCLATLQLHLLSTMAREASIFHNLVSFYP